MTTDLLDTNEYNDICPLMAVAVSHSPPAKDTSPLDYFQDESLSKLAPMILSIPEDAIPALHEERHDQVRSWKTKVASQPTVCMDITKIQQSSDETQSPTAAELTGVEREKQAEAERVVDAIVNEACRHVKAQKSTLESTSGTTPPSDRRHSHAELLNKLDQQIDPVWEQPTPSSLNRSPSPLFTLSKVPTFSLSTSTAPSSTGSMSEQSVNPSTYLSGLTSPTALSICSSTIGGRRRGFMRPQATSFADSARNRDSVMALGTIAHLQYYFARTGLLDGRGGQIARAKRIRNGLEVSHPDLSQAGSRSVSTGSVDAEVPGLLLRTNSLPVYALSDAGLAENSVIDDDGLSSRWGAEAETLDPTMLQPTVSTYHSRLPVAAPAPDLTMLRRELTEALEDALKVLKEAENCTDDSSGFHEIQGLHLLDIATLAIRAAKVYYTAHPHPTSLYALKSERQLRAELFDVLELLQRMAARNFAGGIRQNEKVGLLNWIVDISELIHQEMEAEKKEERRRKDWTWRGNDEKWVDKERERAWLFMKSFADDPESLPPWSASREDEGMHTTLANKPHALLQHLATGIPLIRLHNNLVKISSRPFEQITHVHTDISKPYRRSENLRYWLKAAERRWDLKLDLDVVNLSRIATSGDREVNGKIDVNSGGIANQEATWTQFGKIVLRWCEAIRKELEREWDDAAAAKEAAIARKKSRLADGSVRGEGEAENGTVGASAGTAVEVW